MTRKLEGNNPYEMINNATGDLATKLQQLISKYAEDARVFKLANQFIRWWNDGADKDKACHALWKKAEHLRTKLDKEYGHATATPAITPTSLSSLEKAGHVIGKQIGKASAVTVNATVTGAAVTHRWLKDAAIPATKAGSREFWKGLKATAKATKASYRDARARNSDTSDDLPY